MFESSDSAHYGMGGCSCEKWCSFSQNGFHGNQVSNLGHMAKKYKSPHTAPLHTPFTKLNIVYFFYFRQTINLQGDHWGKLLRSHDIEH